MRQSPGRSMRSRKLQSLRSVSSWLALYAAELFVLEVDGVPGGPLRFRTYTARPRFRISRREQEQHNGSRDHI